MTNIKLVINKEIMKAIEGKLAKGLEMVGLAAEGYAKRNCPVDTGRLRGSITHTVNGNQAVIGTNAEYAAYVEFGTGKYAAGQDGTTKTSWVYKDKFGNYHRAYPMQPRPFISAAIGNHAEEYAKIVADELNR